MKIRHESDYRKKRAENYPPVQEQLDLLFHAMETGEIPVATAWFRAVKQVKDTYPKRQ